jgi:hypothetical protein
MLAGYRAEAAAELTAVRADLRARAERAGREAGQWHAERDRLAEGTGPDAHGHAPRQAGPVVARE